MKKSRADQAVGFLHYVSPHDGQNEHSAQKPQDLSRCHIFDFHMGKGEDDGRQQVGSEFSQEWLEFSKEQASEEELFVETVGEDKNEYPWCGGEQAFQAGFCIFDLEEEKSGKRKKADQADAQSVANLTLFEEYR